ncbi:MAG TPA: PAS domain S-box protein [Tepidisphaeraceae bacterium]|jgi:PAS domain S-box-containing protein|nr:PAS domain S-box protein [Tepidisphaeraceae bacterium]
MAKCMESDAPVALESILCTDELNRRPSRPPDYETENRALVALGQALADSPGTVLQKLAETILGVLRCGSAGISLMTEDGKRFYWPAIAGAWTPHIGGGTPRDFGPCGDVLDRNMPLLFRRPERRYTYIRPVTPPIEEALLVPFHVKGKTVGTIWAIAHNDRRKFDNEDLRQLSSLGRFAASAYQARAASETLEKYGDTRAGLAAIVDSSDDAIVGKTLDGVITSWNRAAEKIFGYTAAEAVGQNITLIIPAERRAEEEDVLAHLRRGEKVDHFETERQTKDGRRINISLTISPIRNGAGEIIGASKIARDITESKRMEAALRDSEIRYRRLFEAAHDGILIVDAKTAKVVDVNRFMLDLLDFPREHFLGKELWEFGVLRDQDENREAMRKLQRESSIRYENLPLQDRDGRRIPVEFVSNIYQEDHHPIIQCNIRDISERKRFEDEVEAHLHNEQLLRMEAETANRAKDIFLATLSHELRTPLSAIVGWTSILRREGCEERDIKEGLEAIERNTKAQVQLIDDVLDVSRMISGKLRLEIRPYELTDVINAGVEVVRPAADARNITLDVQLDPSASRASCDPARIQQVVWNLLSNAIKFTPKGGTVGLTLAREKSDLRIQVSDSGQGIGADLLPYVFDRFRQADSSTRRRFGGLGLGLSIVKQIVEMHGGTVEAQSGGDGSGSMFTVRLPIRAVQIDESGEEPEEKKPADGGQTATAGGPLVRLDGLRVLVVDDEADARRILVKVLKDAGAIVTAAGSAEEALEALPKARPEVLISDLGMPDVDGFDLIRSVRASGHSAKDLPAVALTAFVHKKDQRQALLAGFQVHVPKPIDPHDLLAVVASLAGRTG